MKRIRIKTDASHRPGDGFGMGYVADVSHGRNEREEFSDGKYCSLKCSSTEAERLAAIWSIVNAVSRLDIPKNDYELVLKTDCENIIRKFEDEKCNDDAIKMMKHYKRLFDAFMIFWIPRETNRTADSIARVKLDEGMRND